MTWQPGQSGNPKGGPTKAQRLSELANRYTMDAVHTMVAIMNDMGAKDADRLTAARMLLDRAVGTPVQAVTVNNNLTISLVELLAGLPGQGARLPTIEHEQEPPALVAGISLMEAAAAAEELGQAAADARQVEEEEGELILRPANDDGTPTQLGGE
jgi:hypothetical protein